MIHTAKIRQMTLIISLALTAGLMGCGADQKTPEGEEASVSYQLSSVHPVNGRQGICTDGDCFWVSGSASLTKYDKDWNVIAENTDPFAGYELEVNHIGDIDVWQNELYLGVEYFMDGEGKNIQVAVYDGDTMQLKRVFPFRADTGQLECSGIAVDPDSKTVYMCPGSMMNPVNIFICMIWIQENIKEKCIWIPYRDGSRELPIMTEISMLHAMTAMPKKTRRIICTGLNRMKIIRTAKSSWKRHLMRSPDRERSKDCASTVRTAVSYCFTTGVPALYSACRKDSTKAIPRRSTKYLCSR